MVNPTRPFDPFTPEPPRPPVSLRKNRWRHVNEIVIRTLLFIAASISLVTTVLIIAVLIGESLAFFEDVSFAELFLNFTGEWQPLFGTTQYNIWELVAGTANIVLWSLLFALPIGLAAAIYLSEYAHPTTRKILKPVLEGLAGVPTIVYAYFALTFISIDVLNPLFGIFVFNALAASIVMAVMLIPTIASISEDAMAAVPRELREAAYGLGATRLEVSWRVVVPAAISGIAASVLLAIARVVGETMIVAVAAGSTPTLTLNPLVSIQTMTGYMLQVGLGDAARGSIEYRSLFVVGTTLFAITLLFNVTAQWLVRRFREVYV